MSLLAQHTITSLEQWLGAHGHKPSHARRILRAYYEKGAEADWGALRLPAGVADALQSMAGAGGSVVLRQVAEDETVKLLTRLGDGRTVESVLMADYRADLAAGCVSSQVGCSMGCDFCATAQSGFERNLTAGEIVEQFLALKREARSVGRRVRTLVFMGMGEPMLNLDNVIAAIERIAPNELGALGWRQITVSTVGIVPGIERLRAANLNVHLAVSLHAPDDETRTRLLPMGKHFGVTEIMMAADAYQQTTGRPVTLQYCLLEQVNDTREHAQALAALVRGRRMHVNLLRYNPTGLSLRGVTYQRSSDERADAFITELRGHGVVAHFRRSRGKDIDAACGQLRRRASGPTHPPPGSAGVPPALSSG